MTLIQSKKSHSLFILFLTLTLFVQAQMFPTDEGYIVNFIGDTIRGEVVVKNSFTVKFKAKDAPEYIKLNPEEVKAVVKQNSFYYVSAEIPFTGNKKVFVRELISGDVAFYEFSDTTGNESYYVRKKDDKFRKLNTSNYNSIKKALLLNCDSVPDEKTNITSDYRFNIVANQISMHNAKCSSVDNPFKLKYSTKRTTKLLFNLGFGLDNIGALGYRIDTYKIYTIGFGAYIPFTKNFIFAPEVNLNIRDYGLYPLKVIFPPTFVDIMPISILYRTNKFRVNPNIMFGLMAKFPFQNNLGYTYKFTYAYVIGTGADTKISGDTFLRLQIRYISTNFITDDYNSTIYPFTESGFQFVSSVIF